MANDKLMFSRGQSFEPESELLVQSLYTLTKMGIDRYHSDNFLATKYSCSENYDVLKDAVKDKYIKFCADRADLPFEIKTKEDIVKAFSNPTFEWQFFAIQTEALNRVNADNEVEDVLKLATIDTVGIGDSKSYEINSKSLYQVQEGSYGNNVSRFQRQYKSSITLTPEPKICRISFDVMQIMGIGYDFGRELAKVAMSFRTRMYKDAVEAIYSVTTLPTIFNLGTFAKSTYMQLADRVNSANGNVGVTAYGTRVAFGEASDTVSSGFATQDEINKTGFIGNLFNVRSMLLNQAVDSTTNGYAFQVPNDKLILLSDVSDRVCKIVREGSIMVETEEGKTNSLYNRIYTYKDSWQVGLATQAIYGVVSV